MVKIPVNNAIFLLMGYPTDSMLNILRVHYSLALMGPLLLKCICACFTRNFSIIVLYYNVKYLINIKNPILGDSLCLGDYLNVLDL